MQAAARTVPVSEYAPSIVGEFPRIHRQRPVESSIAQKTIVDILPINLNSNAKLQDRYLEFTVPGVKGSFIDLSKLVLEIKLSLTQRDGVTKLEDTVNVEFSNATSSTIFKSIQVYVGEQMLESNPYFNYFTYIKLLTSMSPLKLGSLGKIGNILSPSECGGVENYTASYFGNLSVEMKSKMKAIKENGLHLTFPIVSDISSCDQYLCDDVPVKIRLELADEAWYLNTDGDGGVMRSHVDYAKLWVTYLQPYSSALQALNNQLNSGESTKSIFNKTLYKSIVLGRQQTSVVCDLPWGGVIPERLYVAMVNMNAFSGSYNRNGLYFSNANLANVTISIDGANVYKDKAHFPHECSHIYYNTLDGLGLDNNHLLDYEGFKKGSTVMVYSLTPDDVQGTLPLEQSGNLRVSIELKVGLDHNLVILLFGDTKGVLSINSERNVLCETRA